MDFYLIENSYPQTREITNSGKIWPIIPQWRNRICTPEQKTKLI